MIMDKKTTNNTTPLCAARLFFPSTYEEALSYEQKQEYLYKCIQNLDERVKALEEKVNND